MIEFIGWRRWVAACAAGTTIALAGCGAPPAFQVSEQAGSRVGTVESITQDAGQNVNSGVGMIGGALTFRNGHSEHGLKFNPDLERVWRVRQYARRAPLMQADAANAALLAEPWRIGIVAP